MKRIEVPVPNLFLLIAPVLSAFLLVLAFPLYNIGMLAWVGLVPIQVAVIGTKPKYAFLLSFFRVRCSFSSGLLVDIFGSGLQARHHAILGLYLGLYFGIYGLLINIISRRCGRYVRLLIFSFRLGDT